MILSTATTRSVLFAASSLMIAAVSASTAMAMAMPIGTDMGLTKGSVLLQQAEYGQHRVYPGANAPAAKQARAARNAPNYFCDKQPGKCR